MKRKIFGILFAVGLAVSLLVLMASPALASYSVDGGNPVIKLNGDPSAGQTFYVGQTIAITGDVQPYAAESGAGYNCAYTNAELWVGGPSGSRYVKVDDYDGGSYPYCAVVDTAYSPTITYPLTATGTHTVTMWSYATVCSGQADWGNDRLTFNVVPPVEVDIDIKPGSDPNSINLGSNGVVPVAILGSASFDAATVNPSTVTLAGNAVRLKGKSGNAGSLEDVNGDGLLDLVVQVYTEGLGLVAGDAIAELTGQTYGGVPIHGSDSIRIVPPE